MAGHLQMVCFADLDVLRSTSAVKHLHCRRIFWMLCRSLKQNRSAMEATVQVCQSFSIKIIKIHPPKWPPKWQIRGVPGSKPWICPSLRDANPAHCHRWAERCILAEGTNELLHPRYKKSLVDFLWLIVNYHRINGLFIGIIHRDLFIDYYQKHN